MAMTRGQFQRELFPGIRELIFRGFNEFPEQYSQIFNVQDLPRQWRKILVLLEWDCLSARLSK